MKRRITLTLLGLMLCASCFLFTIRSQAQTKGNYQTKSLESEAKSISRANLTKAQAVNTPIEYDTVLVFDDAILCDFEKEKTVGASSVLRTTIPYEGMYGTKGRIDGASLILSYYTHSNKASKTATLSLYRYKAKKPIFVFECDENDAYAINLLKLDAGLYFIYASVEYDGQSDRTVQALYVDEEESFLCTVFYGDEALFKRERKLWADNLNAVKPEDCLDLTQITYPTSGANGHVVQVDLWIDKGNELVNDVWSDEFKVYAFSYWIAKNIAYDYYKAYVSGISRQKELSTESYDAYSDASTFAYYTGVGVCWDYANILAIMCRSHGIACTTVDVPGHTYNAVYLRGHWVLIDITRFYGKLCEEADTTKLKEMPIDFQRMTNGYGNYAAVGEIESIGKQLWTFENATK